MVEVVAAPQPTRNTNLPPDPTDISLLLRLLFPYEEEEKTELLALIEDLKLNKTQSISFINAVYWDVERAYGKYRDLAQFNYHANEQYQRFKKNMGIVEGTERFRSENGGNTTANPLKAFVNRWGVERKPYAD